MNEDSFTFGDAVVLFLGFFDFAVHMDTQETQTFQTNEEVSEITRIIDIYTDESKILIDWRKQWSHQRRRGNYVSLLV